MGCTIWWCQLNLYLEDDSIMQPTSGYMQLDVLVVAGYCVRLWITLKRFLMSGFLGYGTLISWVGMSWCSPWLSVPSVQVSDCHVWHPAYSHSHQITSHKVSRSLASYPGVWVRGYSVTWCNFDPVYKYFYSDTQITSPPFPPHSHPQSPQPLTASDWSIFNKWPSLLMRWSVPDTTDQCYLSNWYDNLWQPQPATQPSDLFSLFAARLRLPRLTYSTVMPQRSHIGTNSVPSCICG